MAFYVLLGALESFLPAVAVVDFDAHDIAKLIEAAVILERIGNPLLERPLVRGPSRKRGEQQLRDHQRFLNPAADRHRLIGFFEDRNHFFQSRILRIVVHGAVVDRGFGNGRKLLFL